MTHLKQAEEFERKMADLTRRLVADFLASERRADKLEEVVKMTAHCGERFHEPDGQSWEITIENCIKKAREALECG